MSHSLLLEGVKLPDKMATDGNLHTHLRFFMSHFWCKCSGMVCNGLYTLQRSHTNVRLATRVNLANEHNCSAWTPTKMFYWLYSIVLPKVTGWEKNDKNKSVPKMVNLSSSMDPVRWVWLTGQSSPARKRSHLVKGFGKVGTKGGLFTASIPLCNNIQWIRNNWFIILFTHVR